MKVLYAIQGTGNGHLCRANDVVPILKKLTSVDVLVSGVQADVKVDFDIDFKRNGLSFIFGKHGGVNLWNTYKRAHTIKLMREIAQFPIQDYDLLINDFEPLTAWAAKKKGVPSISLSHQAAVLHPSAPRPSREDFIGRNVLKYYAPTKHKYGFHFESYAENIFTPIIRQQVRRQTITDNGHVTVYLPSYGEKVLVSLLSQIKEVQWEVFSKHSKCIREYENVHIHPINNDHFVKSMAAASGVLCGAGFETPAEALFMDKKMMVIPMTMQYEQHCNAAALQKMGVPVLDKLDSKHLSLIKDWVASSDRVQVNYQDQTEKVLLDILSRHFQEKPSFA